jgi:hypothetical protein
MSPVTFTSAVHFDGTDFKLNKGRTNVYSIAIFNINTNK